MTRNIFIAGWYICVCLFSATAFAQSPAWSVNPNEYQYSLTITATLNIDGKIANESTDKVGAFVNGVCRGVGTASTTTAGGNRLVFLQVYSDNVSGENITFKMYDASLNRTLDAVNIIPFQSDAAFGSVSDPYVITSNNDPTTFSLTSTSIVEAESKNSTVGVFSTVDPDTASVFTYRFIDSLPNDNSSFLIVGNELKTNAVFDYNVKSSYTIYVLVEDGKGGTLMKRIEIMVTPSEDKFVADNYLSPNGDGINDLWEINNHQLYKNYQVSIFNEAGVLVFSQKPYDNKWSGTNRDQTLPAGNYFYLVKNTEGDQKFTGTISLVK